MVQKFWNPKQYQKPLGTGCMNNNLLLLFSNIMALPQKEVLARHVIPWLLYVLPSQEYEEPNNETGELEDSIHNDGDGICSLWSLERLKVNFQYVEKSPTTRPRLYVRLI